MCFVVAGKRDTMVDHDITRIRSKAQSHWHKVLTPVVLVTVCFCAVCAHILIDARRTALERAGDTATSMVAAIESDIVRNVETLNLSLQGVINNLKHPEIDRISPDLRQLVLFDHSATARHFGSILVLDETGRLRYDSRNVNAKPLDLSDRDYFRIHKTKEAPVLYVGQPQAARQSGAFFIGISKRLTHEDGSFAGVVAGTVQLSYFKKLFKDMALGANGTIVLARTDGTLLMRWPFDEALVGKSMKNADVFRHLETSRSGRFETVSISDGVPRLSVYTQISDLPIVVVVGQAKRDIYSQWRQYAWTIGFLIATLVAMSAALAWFLLRELNWHRDAEQKLATLASTDGLTGLSNRWHFDETIRREWRRARRDHMPISLLMVDADEFKSYNDTHGHQAGDRLLRMIGEAISETIQRGADLGARYGGDEFAVLLPGTALEGAARVADQIRRRFNADCAEQGIVNGAKLSIGAACLIPERTASHATLLTAADEALYRAKDAGRNRTELAEAAYQASLQPLLISPAAPQPALTRAA
jgi:diguanylate cyclase (GGDEF)-like protein